MLKVTVEIIPFGDQKRARTIGEMCIVNNADHEERPKYGNYSVIAVKYGDEPAKKREVVFSGVLKNFNRKLGFWQLIHEALLKFTL